MALPVLASANGAMGLGLEIFDLRYWFAYVVATVVFEAWFIGRWMGKSWMASLLISLIANSVTAFCCVNIAAVGLHAPFVGSRINPNPFFNVVAVFFVFGIVSAFVELFVWLISGRSHRGDGRLILRTLAAHVLGVPLGLCILLIPPRPYYGTAMITGQMRRQMIGIGLRKRLERLQDTDRLPRARDLQELWDKLPPDPEAPPDAWCVIYIPEYGRFATGETRAQLFGEWNTTLGGLTREELMDRAPVWLVRRKNPGGEAYGFVFEPDGDVRATTDPAQLGY